MNENLEQKLGNIIDVTRLNIKNIIETTANDIKEIDKEWAKKINTITSSGKTAYKVYSDMLDEKDNLEEEKRKFLNLPDGAQDVESLKKINEKLAQINNAIDTYNVAKLLKDKEKEEIKYTRQKEEIAKTIKYGLEQSIKEVQEKINSLKEYANKQSKKLSEAFDQSKTEEVSEIMNNLSEVNEQIKENEKFISTAKKILVHNAYITGSAIKNEILKDVSGKDMSYDVLSTYYDMIEKYQLNMKKHAPIEEIQVSVTNKSVDNEPAVPTTNEPAGNELVAPEANESEPAEPVSEENHPMEDISSNTPEKPSNIRKNPKLTWKTAVAAVVGIGLGVGVTISFGPVGVAVMSAAGSFGKQYLGKKRAEARMQRLSGKSEVQDVQEIAPGLKGKLQKFRQYINSEEGLRDLTWLINSAIISGTALTVGTSIYNAINATKGTISVPVNETISTTSTPTTVGPKTISIDKVYDSASWAHNGINAENPLSYINATEGSVVTKIQDGAALISKGGVAQGWIPADGVNVGDLVEAAAKVGGKI